MKTNLGLLQMRDKFAREALMDLPADAPMVERAALMKAASDARRAHALGVQDIVREQRLAVVHG